MSGNTMTRTPFGGVPGEAARRHAEEQEREIQDAVKAVLKLARRGIMLKTHSQSHEKAMVIILYRNSDSKGLVQKVSDLELHVKEADDYIANQVAKSFK